LWQWCVWVDCTAVQGCRGRKWRPESVALARLSGFESLLFRQSVVQEHPATSSTIQTPDENRDFLFFNCTSLFWGSHAPLCAPGGYLDSIREAFFELAHSGNFFLADTQGASMAADKCPDRLDSAHSGQSQIHERLVTCGMVPAVVPLAAGQTRIPLAHLEESARFPARKPGLQIKDVYRFEETTAIDFPF
jgi:hypothetical protein